jgi:hypothetical protein
MTSQLSFCWILSIDERLTPLGQFCETLVLFGSHRPLLDGACLRIVWSAAPAVSLRSPCPLTLHLSPEPNARQMRMCLIDRTWGASNLMQIPTQEFIILKKDDFRPSAFSVLGVLPSRRLCRSGLASRFCPHVGRCDTTLELRALAINSLPLVSRRLTAFGSYSIEMELIRQHSRSPSE